MSSIQSLDTLDNCNSFSTTEVSTLKEDVPSDDLQFLKLLADSRYPVFLAYSTKYQKQIAVKAFPYKDGDIHPSFLNECRFSNLNHENIIRKFGKDTQTEIEYKSKIIKASCIHMELAKCNFGEVILKCNPSQDEKLVRTFFHQLVEGIDYLHSQGVAHLDLKVDNLLLGHDYLLKITDFDSSHHQTDTKLLGKGTENYRAPDLARQKCSHPMKADIYSMGIILFVLKFGFLPYDEDEQIMNYDLLTLALTSPENFWIAHEKINSGPLQCDEEFKSLFVSMIQYKPEKRISIPQIRSSKWYQGETYTPSELKEILEAALNPLKK